MTTEREYLLRVTELEETLESLLAHIKTLPPESMGREPGPSGWFYRDEAIERITKVLLKRTF